MSATEITVDTGTLLTISTGRHLTDEFGKFHAAADVLAGQPLMTSNFASQALSDQLRNEVHRQHPWTADPLLMDDFPSMEGLDRDEVREACQAWVQQHTDKHGDAHRLTTPPEVRHVPLFEGLERLGENR